MRQFIFCVSIVLAVAAFGGNTVLAQSTPVIRAQLAVKNRAVLCEYSFGSNGVVFCSCIDRDTFEKASDSLGIWSVTKDKQIAIKWYSNSIIAPTVSEVLRVNFSTDPLQFQIVEHDDKSQVNSITKADVEMIGGGPAANIKQKLTSVINSIDATHAQLLLGGGNLSSLQRREMFKALDSAEISYRNNQKAVQNVKDNPLKKVLVQVKADAPIAKP